MKRTTGYNIGLAIWRLKCFNETFVQGSTAVILLNFCAKNPPHRQAENRYLQPQKLTFPTKKQRIDDRLADGKRRFPNLYYDYK
jgi:hypothetical protein